MSWKLISQILIVIISFISLCHSEQESSFFGSEITVVQKLYDDCQSKNDFTGCLKERALSAISKALEQDTIKITDGLTLERQNSTEETSIISGFTDARTFSTYSQLDRSLLEKADKFFRTHVLKFDLKEDEITEGRKKKKDNGIKYVVAALLTAMGIAGPLGLKALAAIAGKALVISKVALTIASIIALKKLFTHDHHEETTFQVHANEHNRRNTYVVKPVTKNAPATLDPYKYYYEYPAH